jgi:hypothetical protein
MRFKISSFVNKTWKTSSIQELNNKKFFNHDDIWTLLELLNVELKKRNVRVNIQIFGGAAICLTLGEQARESTKDIDACYNQRAEVEDAVADIALKYGLFDNWLEYLSSGLRAENLEEETFQHLYSFSHLTVYTISPEYMLAQKLFSKRQKLMDLQDIKYIWGFLNKPTIERIQEIWQRYFPSRNFPQDKFLLAIKD